MTNKIGDKVSVFVHSHKLIAGIVMVALSQSFFMLCVDSLRLLNLDPTGTGWKLISSLQRLIFFVIELKIFCLIYEYKNWKEVLHFKGFRQGLYAGIGMISFTIYYSLYLILCNDGIEISGPLLAGVILQQVMTGLWEELTFRSFMIEGFLVKGYQKWYCRLTAAILSAVVFGLLHAIDCDSISVAFYRFCTTGIIGLSFAAAYIYSHNIIVPMVMHAVYDIPANLISYVVDFRHDPTHVFMDSIWYPMFAVVFLWSIVFVLRRPRTKEALS